MYERKLELALFVGASLRFCVLVLPPVATCVLLFGSSRCWTS
jgi:hypothetical protein